MLHKLSDKAAECYRLAREAREKADRASDETLKRDYLALERRWIKLAQSHELVQRVSTFNIEIRRRLALFKPRTPPHPALPSAVCPTCGKVMRLAQIAPSPEGAGQDMTLSCSCGHQLTLPFGGET